MQSLTSRPPSLAAADIASRGCVNGGGRRSQEGCPPAGDAAHAPPHTSGPPRLWGQASVSPSRTSTPPARSEARAPGRPGVAGVDRLDRVGTGYESGCLAFLSSGWQDLRVWSYGETVRNRGSQGNRYGQAVCHGLRARVSNGRPATCPAALRARIRNVGCPTLPSWRTSERGR